MKQTIASFVIVCCSFINLYLVYDLSHRNKKKDLIILNKELEIEILKTKLDFCKGIHNNKFNF